MPPEIKQPTNFDESINGIDQEKPEIIRLKIKRNKRRYSELLNIESIPASGIVEISVFSQAWLVRALCAAQGDIEILNGAEVAGPIVARSTKILALYQS